MTCEVGLVARSLHFQSRGWKFELLEEQIGKGPLLDPGLGVVGFVGDRDPP